MKGFRRLKNGLWRVYCPICGAPMWDELRTDCGNFGGLRGTYTERVNVMKDSELVHVGSGMTHICVDCMKRAHVKRDFTGAEMWRYITPAELNAGKIEE